MFTVINLFDLKRDENKHISDKPDIAIIGASIHLPMADSLLELRESLLNKVDLIRDIPRERKKKAIQYLRTQQNVKDFTFQRCGYLDDISQFDYEFFKITPTEARLMDPFQRNLLTAAYEALDDAGYTGDDIRGSKTGVYVGNISINGHNYMDMIMRTQTLDDMDMAAIGNLNSMISSRIAYFLDLKGPCMLIDTACSSSLVALHEACDAIRNHDCEKALVMSARFNLLPIVDGVRLGMESDRGVIRAFDEKADGTVRGEGVIAYLLKPLEFAIEDKDYIYGVIKGSAVNQDGTTMGITSPNAQVQSEVIQKAWEKSRINPKEIECFEAHGTGTIIGDTIEIEGITKAFKKYTDKLQFCAVSSIKSNIGHLYDCSALAGLAKCILQLQYKELIPGTNFEFPNSKIEFSETPLYVNDKYRPWISNYSQRLCSLSSFGFSGTNCHVVLTEAPIEYRSEVANKLGLLTVSAYSFKLLIKTIDNYCSFIESSPESEIDNICYSINARKQDFPLRLAIIFNKREDLILKMKELIKEYNRDIINGFEYTSHFISIGSIKEDSYYLKLQEIGKKYIEGAIVNWSEIYLLDKVRKVQVPLTPMDKRDCWLDFSHCVLKDDSVSVERTLDKNIEIESKQEVNYTYEDIVNNLIEITKKLLGLDKLDPSTNLLDIGVDSILYTKLHKKINNMYPDILSISKMFVYPTIELLAQYICNESAKENEGYVAVTKEDIDIDQLLKDFMEDNI